MGQVTGAGDTPVRWPTHSLLPHPGIVGVDQERGPEKVEEGEEEDPVWLLSENSNPVGGKLVSLSGGEGEWRVQGLQKNTFDPKEAAVTQGGQFAEHRPILCSQGSAGWYPGSPDAFFSRCLAKPQLKLDSLYP